jgi:hypothetical protein
MPTSTRAVTRPASATNARQVYDSDTVTDWLAVRRALNAKDASLHERTFKWLATLPRSIRPMTTARQYSRIVNRIGDLWGNCEYTRLYLQSLLLDRRGGRKGLPPNVRQEIEVLQQYYFEHLSGLPALLWNAIPLAVPTIPEKAFPPIMHRNEIEIQPL